MQAEVFVPTPPCAHGTGFRLWRSSGHRRRTEHDVARYLGEARTRSSFESFAATRRISLQPQLEADVQLLRYAEHQLASAIGAASSRLVLSLLLRKRTVSTQAALKLLDDANAAIHYNREILQTALDHVRQGIAVYDKEMRLVCWNRQFGRNPQPAAGAHASGRQSRRDRPLQRPAGRARPWAMSTRWCARGSNSTPTTTSPISNASSIVAWWSRSAPTRMPDGGIVTTATDITPSVVAAEALERANATLEMRVRERTTELTRLNAELGRAKAEADEANISKDPLRSLRRATTSCSR